MQALVSFSLYAEFQNWFLAQWLALPPKTQQAWLKDDITAIEKAVNFPAPASDQD